MIPSAIPAHISLFVFEELEDKSMTVWCLPVILMAAALDQHNFVHYYMSDFTTIVLLEPFTFGYHKASFSPALWLH